MYGNCTTCGRAYGTMDGKNWFTPCEHVKAWEKEFAEKRKGRPDSSVEILVFGRMERALAEFMHARQDDFTRQRIKNKLTCVMQGIFNEGHLHAKMPIVDINGKLLKPRLEERFRAAEKAYAEDPTVENFQEVAHVGMMLDQLEEHLRDPSRLNVFLLNDEHDQIEDWNKFANWGK